uniref:Zinc finger LSD1-type domain-containing protein n=1 Tax=Oryza punctata TaxID=4537 RepID=A0A0E0KV06_ORYPU
MAPPPGILEVRCAGCGETLEVEHGLTEFACPDCGMAQALPPELMPPRPRRALPLPGRAAVVPSAVPAAAATPPSRVSCGGCAAVLSVPHGPGRFSCPLCGAEIAPPPLAAVVSVVAPPAAIPITSNRPAITSEVLNGNSNQPTLAGQVQKSIISEQHYKHSFREESFSSFRVDSRTQIPEVGRLQSERVNPSADREESRTEPLNRTMTKPGKKKTISAAGPKSHPAGKLQEEHINKVIHASRAQGMPSNSVAGFHNGMIAVHNKQKTGLIAAPSAIEHEQINALHQVCDEQQPGENSSDLVHVEQVQVACKAVQNNKKGTKYTKGNQKRQGKSPLTYSTELPHLRRSKRLTKGSPDPIDIEPIHRIDASPNQNQSETPLIERMIDDTYPISPNQHRYPQSVSNKLDNVDAATPALNHSMQQKEIIPQCYSQMYSPESRWALPNRSSNSCHEHEMPNESFDGIAQLDSSDDEVHSIPLENQNQDMDGQLEQQACAGKNLSEQDSKNLAEHGRQKNGFIGSSGEAKHHGDLSSGMGTRHQINLAASCSRLAALLPVADATPLPTISSPSSFESLSVPLSSMLNCFY